MWSPTRAPSNENKPLISGEKHACLLARQDIIDLHGRVTLGAKVVVL
jgi:hypothetical protein